jgi:sugar lactone lactonase YvrE
MRSKAGLFLCCLMLLVVGCRTAGNFTKDDQPPIDRSVVEHPPGTKLYLYADNFNCPTGLCFDQDGTMFVAEGGIDNVPIHILGRRPDHSVIEIYPSGIRVPFLTHPFKIYGPIGGIAASNGTLFVSHRDVNGMGVISAFTYDGKHSTVVSEFPAQGDYGITDIAVRPTDGRIFFGVGPATNSGVVGPDNWAAGWLKHYPNACDVSPIDVKLFGLKFTSPNPAGGFFGGGDRAFTGPLQPFNVNNRTKIKKADDDKANSAVYSISPTGGDLTLECFGIRLPRGLGFDEYYAGLFATNDGMEMRGTRPIKDDPDAFVKIATNAWYGFPDFSTDFNPINDERYQPPESLMTRINSGYPDINALIDLQNSKLLPATSIRNQLKGVFPPLSGAAKFDFIPSSSTIAPYKPFLGRAIVALSGDRAPFATSGQPLTGPIGYKVVCVDPFDAKHQPIDFVYNTKGMPASKLGRGAVALERPCDVKLSPDGSLYILDMGSFTMKDGREHISQRTGRIFRLKPDEEPQRPAPTTEPAK